ncbi:hypothetical protein BDQ17DRAFT_1360993 [Cyathus striatus]|nr:hypothetical protein BDQ17DRAFT_1360993 [Cyathus striatus]
MYSDSSDDESDLNYENLSMRMPSWPYLRLHEKNEYNRRYTEAKRIYELKIEGADPATIEKNDHYKLWGMIRFFDSIKGFHQGNLDFSGRHQPRYESLLRRWNYFLVDYIELSVAVEAHEHESELEIPFENGTEKYTSVKYEIKDNKKWDTFAKKWHLCTKAGYGFLVNPIERLLIELANNPIPKFQKLCLLDLPVEILDYIFSFATIKQARLLSSACHKLRTIGKPYIFVSRSLKLELPHTFWSERAAARKQGDTPESLQESLIETIKTCKTDLIKQAEFLLSRPDLMNVVSSLWIGFTAMDMLRRAGVNVILGNAFFAPMFKVLKDVILNCRNLRDLSISTLDLSSEILQAACSLCNLITLDLHCITPQKSILNLVLMDSSQPTFNVWAPVAMCSSLRTLSVVNIGTQTLEPSLLVSRRSKVFATLEKLNVGPISNAGVLDLTRWIELNSAEAPLTLTHLKMSAATGLEERFIFQLVDALESAPLQVLVLEGIKEGSFELFDRIAAKCPHLLGLTVIRRENVLQKDTKLATWPHASYEYAPHFSAFQRLEHFSWNFRVSDLDQTPAAMQYFEEGFISEDEVFRRHLSGEFTEDDDYFFDAYYVAYPFAAHCRTLKSFAIVSGRMLDNFCYIKRKANGLFELAGVDMLRSLNSGLLDKWDVPPLYLHWPYIIPKGNIDV